MLVNNFYGTYFCWKNDVKDFIILKSIDQVKQLDYKILFTNNSDGFKNFENLVDLRIFNWLINNLSNYNYLCYLKEVNNKNLKDLVDNQIKWIMNNKWCINQAKEYTKYYHSINNLFKFDYNKNELLQLKEKYNFQMDTKKQIKDYKLDVAEDINFDEFEDGIKYSFLNKIGKIYPSNSLLQKIDRKNNINLFKSDKNKKYFLCDFISFEPTMLFLYTKNKMYKDINFYKKCGDYFKLDRKEFKNNFLMWINGASENKLGELFNKFNNNFKDLVQLKNKINNGKFTNYFKHTLFYEKEYSKLGALISSTSFDYLYRLYNDLYLYSNDDNNQNKINFIFNLFDEFLISVDKEFDINILKNKVKIFNLRIEEV